MKTLLESVAAICATGVVLIMVCFVVYFDDIIGTGTCATKEDILWYQKQQDRYDELLERANALFDGKGVERNYQEAYQLYREATLLDVGASEAYQRLEYMNEHGLDASPN